MSAHDKERFGTAPPHPERRRAEERTSPEEAPGAGRPVYPDEGLVGVHEPAAADAGSRHLRRQEIDPGEEREREREPAPAPEGAATALFSREEAQRMQARWLDIQAGFVDEPRQAVQQADQLVEEAIRRLSEMFTGERNQLERQWAQGETASTEDLRVALQRYRAFFDRLLSV